MDNQMKNKKWILLALGVCVLVCIGAVMLFVRNSEKSETAGKKKFVAFEDYGNQTEENVVSEETTEASENSESKETASKTENEETAEDSEVSQKTEENETAKESDVRPDQTDSGKTDDSKTNEKTENSNQTEESEQTNKEEPPIEVTERIEATYEEWLAASMVVAMSLHYGDFEISEIYLTGETDLLKKQESTGCFIVFAAEGTQIILQSKPLAEERTEAGTFDLHANNIGFATFDRIDSVLGSVEKYKQITVTELEELIAQSLLVTVYEH